MACTFKAMEYIANRSNSSIIRKSDYFHSKMDVDANVEWVSETRECSNKKYKVAY